MPANTGKADGRNLLVTESSERWPLRKICQQADSPFCCTAGGCIRRSRWCRGTAFSKHGNVRYSLEPSRASERTGAAYLCRLSRSLYSKYIVTPSYEPTSEALSVVVLAGDRRSKMCLCRATQPASQPAGLLLSTHRGDHARLELCGWPIADVSAFFGRRSLASGGRSHRYRHRKRRNGMGNRLGPSKSNARCRRSSQTGRRSQVARGNLPPWRRLWIRTAGA